MNLNDLAKEICKREGKKVSVNIAQVKEILKILIDIFSENFTLDRNGELHYLNLDGYYGLVDRLAHEAFVKKLKKTKKKVKKK